MKILAALLKVQSMLRRKRFPTFRSIDNIKTKIFTSNDRVTGSGPGERNQQHIAVQISIAGIFKFKFSSIFVSIRRHCFQVQPPDNIHATPAYLIGSV